MFHKRLADKIKSGLAWSVISEDGERIPTNNNDEDSESNSDNQSHFSLNTDSLEKKDALTPASDSLRSMEKMLDNSRRKFQPEFYLKKTEKEKESTIKEPPVKRPTAAFRVTLDQNSGSGEVTAIEIPQELVQSGELLAESVISMSLSVLSAEKTCEASSKRELPSSSDRERSIEFKSYASKEFCRTG